MSFFQYPQTKGWKNATSGLTGLGIGCRLKDVVVSCSTGAQVDFYDGVSVAGTYKFSIIVSTNAPTTPYDCGDGIEFATSLFWTSSASVDVTVQGEGNFN
jgi:hypothetical protein